MKKPLQPHLLKRVPPACKGGEDHEVAREAADWRSGPRWSILSVLCPVHPFATTWHFTHREACHWIRGSLLSPMNPVPLPPQGETRDMREKTASHILQVPLRHSPFGGWRHHLARWEACHWIRGSQSSPMNPVPLPPPQAGHYGCLAMWPCLCRKA